MLTRALSVIRLLAFLVFVAGLLLRLMSYPGSTATLLAAALLMLVSLVGHLINGGWANSYSDERVRLAGHMLMFYGFASFLTWLWQLPFGWQAIGSGAVLLLIATVLRRRRLRETQGPESRIDEIGRED